RALTVAKGRTPSTDCDCLRRLLASRSPEQPKLRRAATRSIQGSGSIHDVDAELRNRKRSCARAITIRTPTLQCAASSGPDAPPVGRSPYSGQRSVVCLRLFLGGQRNTKRRELVLDALGHPLHPCRPPYGRREVLRRRSSTPKYNLRYNKRPSDHY